jgi:hypothetical protein
MRNVLGTLKNNQLFMKRYKCLFYEKQVEYLGHIISPDCVAIVSKKI